MTGATHAGTLRLREPSLFEPVLERVVAALAARVDLPVDRLSDAQLMAAALASGARRHAPDGTLCVELAVAPQTVSLSVGPLPPGTASRLVADSAVPGLGPVLERLADSWAVTRDEEGRERLELTIGAAAGVSPAAASPPGRGPRP
jgi:serine/threonine-protein kinase RsbW